MKKRNILICTVLIVAMLFSMAVSGCNGCKKKKPDEEHQGGGGSGPVVDKETDTDLISNGKTQYKIVIPENASEFIKTGENELRYFFSEATGIKLNTITDENLSFSESDKYLSIGNTNLAKESGVTVSFEELGNDGVRLVTAGNTVIMQGGSDRGSLYSVYEFLERTFNLEVYAEDEFYIDRDVKNRKLKAFDVKEIPVFSRRSVGLFPYTINATFRNRMRQEKYDEGWIYWSHSHFKIIPPEIYAGEHPDWFSPDMSQLCLTNDEMRKEFTKNVIELVKTHPDCGYIMLGQQDVNTFCGCERCKKEIEKYKKSGVMMHFINKVADDVQKYIDENEPGREFYVCTFAYHQTEQAPVLDKLGENGEYIPIDDSVRPHKNVRIMIAPIYACNCHDYFDSSHDECNKVTERVFKSWASVAEGHIFVWMYNKIFSNYFIPFGNFPTIVKNYDILHDLGTLFVYHQGNKEINAGGMQELMSYVEAKLMWDTSLNFEDLVSDFISHYYREAGEYYQQYYDLIRFNYTIWTAEGLHMYNSSNKAKDIFDRKYWTQDLLEKFFDLFDKMLVSVEKYKDEDLELYNKLVLRIKKERLTVQYLYMSFYLSYMPEDEAVAMIDEFENVCMQANLSVWCEQYSNGDRALISNLVSGWRKSLL